jgi:hypothetical protein
MDFVLVLILVFLMVFLVLALLLVHVLFAPKVTYDPNHQALPPQSQAIHTSWKNTLFKILVMRPWPYSDLWNPLNRLYWPDEQQNNRSQRRHSRRKRNR